jgi:hypothetical protein
MADDTNFAPTSSLGDLSGTSTNFGVSNSPSYIQGADNHNLGNSGSSWYDPTTWGSTAESVGKFAAVSALSGAASIYDTAATVGNWFGADVKIRDNQEWIASLDQDLGQYYGEHRQSADLAGFVATSLIPGMGGIKILNAGQAALKAAKYGGVLGKNMSLVTNILAPSTENFVKLAAADIASAQSVHTVLGANTLKALGSGIHQNILEGAAFETFVQATMAKSPILDSQDNWDIAKNIAVGGVLGGVVGGALEAAKTISTVKKARYAEEFRMHSFDSREVVQPGTKPADRIILGAENRELTPAATAPQLPENATAADIQLYNAQLANASKAVEKKSTQIDLDTRAAMHEMNAGAPTDLINAVADTQTGLSTQSALSNWHQAVEITRPNVVTKLETEAAKNLDAVPISSRWVKLTGENAGQITSEAPYVLSLADRVAVTKTGSIADAVLNDVKSYKFKPNSIFDSLASTAEKTGWKEAEARHIWADQVDLSKTKDLTIGANDLPMLERMVKDGRTDFTMVTSDGTRSQFGAANDVKQYVIDSKDRIANELLARRIGNLDPATNSIETTTAAIAKTVNVDQGYLEGTRDAVNSQKGLFSWQDQTAAHQAEMVNRGLANPNDVATPIYLRPQVAKVNYQAEDMIGADGHVLDGMTWIKSQQKISHDTALNVVSKQAGNDIASRMPEVRLDQLMRSGSQGAGAGLLTFAKAAYGSLESTMQLLGGVSKDMQSLGRTNVDNKIQAALYALKTNKEASIEFSTVNQLLSKTAEDYVFDSNNILGMGKDILIPKKVRDAFAKNAEGETNALDAGDISLQVGAPQYIQFKNWETAQAFQAHTDLNAASVANRSERYAALGKLDQRDPDIIRPVNPSPKDFPFFAFVKDPKVTGAGHTTMLFANSDRELQALITKTNQSFPDLQVLTKKDTADWYAAHQGYEYERGLNENYIDTQMKRQGIYSNFYTQTDPDKIVNDVLQYHYRASDAAQSDIMRLRYGEVFDWLENQAGAYSNVESSQFKRASVETIQQNEKNPFMSYIKTALNLPSTPTSNPWWSLNKFIDTQGSSMVGRVRQTFDAIKNPENLGQVNDILQKYGSQTSFNSAAEIALVNHTAPKAEISKFVRGANSIMSRFTLGLDPLNAVNNAIGANVLRGTELNQITKAIAGGNSELAGQLAELAKVKIPGVEDYVTSPTKLIAKSIGRFFDSELRPQLLAEYKSQGFIRNRLEQFASMQDDLTLQGTETVKDLGDRLGSAFGKAKALTSAGLDKAEALSGNGVAEEFNRFLSADVMRQITDLGESHGLLTRQESLTYINNFVNRVEGNTIASQRPGLFQGPVGQAIGLFQSYQFNMLQNMFRYVAEGGNKDLGMLLGLQSTFYGLQGTPGFKFLNDHIVGTLSGNTQHRDIYDVTRGIAGKTGGDWLLYGAASNIMQTNLYSRGDINPRTITIVPTNLADVPFVGGMSKVFGTLYDTANRLAAGGNVWETIRQGIEHNGVSRPLAGLAQVSRGVTGDTVFSTSSKGTILGSNDLMSIATLSRLAGGRPLDEAIQNDTMFSINSYEAIDRRKKQLLAEAVKSTQIQGQEASGDQVTQFAAKYAEMGGKQSGFAKYMMENYTKANTTQASILAAKLNNPLSYKIQALMGGDDS